MVFAAIGSPPAGCYSQYMAVVFQEFFEAWKSQCRLRQVIKPELHKGVFPTDGFGFFHHVGRVSSHYGYANARETQRQVPWHGWTGSRHVVVGVEFTGRKPLSASTIEGLRWPSHAAWLVRSTSVFVYPKVQAQVWLFACISIVTNIYIASALGVC
jgi:hypothetical protein